LSHTSSPLVICILKRYENFEILVIFFFSILGFELRA
jgi:hypothetical protein